MQKKNINLLSWERLKSSALKKNCVRLGTIVHFLPHIETSLEVNVPRHFIFSAYCISADL